jgi:hypothetical protein
MEIKTIKSHFSSRYDAHGNDTYSIYEEFYNNDDADEALRILNRSGLEYATENPTPQATNTIIVGGQSMLPVVVIYANAANFQQFDDARAAALMALSNGAVPTKYHLRDFSNDELFKLICEKQNWHFQDYMFAKALLGERGIAHEAADITNWRANQAKLMWHPKSLNEIQLIGLLLACTLISATGSYIALAFSLPLPYFIWTGKSKDLNGKSHPTYNENTQHWGLGIFIFSVIAFYIGIQFRTI